MNLNMRAGARPARREAADLPEPGTPDRRLDQLLHVRKARLGRLERERDEARLRWRERRQALSALKLRWRRTRDEAQAEWQAARAAFTAMTITSGEFKKARAVYERMKKSAAQLRVQWQELRPICRADGAAWFAAREVVRQASRQEQKMTMLRDELREAWRIEQRAQD